MWNKASWVLVGVLCAAILVLLYSRGEASNPTMTNSSGEVTNQSGENGLLTVNDRIGDMTDHPAFDGFGQLLLPWDNRTVDADMPLTQMDQLMPYHGQINPENSVAAVNHLIEEQQNGQRIFYPIYAEEEMAGNPQKRNTGLFFYRGEADAPYAVVAPGGGFSYVGSLHEGFPYAMEISQAGYNAFVSKYEVGNERIATEDLARAISFIEDHAEELEVSTEDYSLWGSSAGARMVANIGTNGVAAYGGDARESPATIVTAYTGHRNYGEEDTPTFAVVSEDDPIASADTMRTRIQNLQDSGVNAEIVTFNRVGHGFGLGIGTEAEGWEDQAMAFWQNQIEP
ncbi:alpha/beta hydrolase [Enterococcus sp. 669A]|uniref:Alpha/beta hydrolase n=1 Tax=Candidatus Enterococcus moelleringii TaxID=2815325 RepID=A0ABS3LCQ8_9ENTE|nr:alpha/beta hydrolase [Enterococcus sp. 669A]MBO1307418.1 alpha/beta hydrolase [Enterococcus sp. 669A]